MPDRCRRAVSGSIMQKKKPVRLDSRAGFRAVWGLIVWGCGRCTASSVGGWVSDLGRVGVCCVCPGIPPGGLIVGVRVVLGVLLPVLRRSVACCQSTHDLPRRGALVACIRARAGCVLRRYQSVAAMWVWDSSQQVLATQGAVYVQGHCLQEQRIVYTAALLASSRPSARAHDFP